MNYSVKELREKLTEKVYGLGINPSFKDNPAFASALAEIEHLISQMNIFEEAEHVTVRQEERSISFNWTSSTGNKYSMSISSPSPETFRCIRTEEKEPFLGTNGKLIKEKNAIETVTTLDKSGFITIMESGSMIDNAECDIGKCNNSTWAEKKYYSSDGVMIEREYKGFGSGILSEDIDRARVGSMLYIPRQAFNFGTWHNSYERRTLLVRDKLDTARVVCEDKKERINYHAVTPLNQEYGLRDMILPGGYEPYPKDIVIQPLLKEEIEEMIQRENNPKVAEGLREYAVGRDTYYYNSAEDGNYVNTSKAK